MSGSPNAYTAVIIELILVAPARATDDGFVPGGGCFS
jgi:hypothetical protein